MLHILAAVVALADPTGPAIDARIADVIADPERYGGQTLRIRGQVDACYLDGCRICPEEMRPGEEDREERRCLRIGLEDFSAEDDLADPDGPPFERSPRREVAEIFRFTVVTAEGVFDPQCLTGKPWPPEPEPAPSASSDAEATMIDEIICTGGVDLTDARVSKVHRRLPSNDGLAARRHSWPLTPASPTIATAAEAAYRDYVLIFDPGPDWTPIAVFQTEFPNFDDRDREAWACVCRIDDCSDAWPKREISVWARTVNDPYFCYFTMEVAGAWRVFPE